MIPQQLGKFRRGSRLAFGRWLGHAPSTVDIGWTEGAPFCVQRVAYDAVALVFPQHDARTMRSEGAGRRVMGSAASRDGRVLVAVFEDPAGARMVVGDRSLVFPKERADVHVVTDGRTVVASSHRAPRVWSTDVALGARTSWLIDDEIHDMRSIDDGVLIGTARAWSQWTFDGKRVHEVPAPPMAPYSRATLVAWNQETPVFYGMHDATTTHDVFVWDVARRRARSLGESQHWPRGVMTKRALVIDRSPPHAPRCLELWNKDTWTLVESLEIRGHAVDVMSSGPGDEITLASRDHLFTMCVS
jgi:hypothetical protein